MRIDLTSRDVAKRRLSQVLVHDRASVSPELMDALKCEVVKVAANFVHTDTSQSTVHLELGKEASTLVIRIPVLGVGRERAGSENEPN